MTNPLTDTHKRELLLRAGRYAPVFSRYSENAYERTAAVVVDQALKGGAITSDQRAEALCVVMERYRQSDPTPY